MVQKREAIKNMLKWIGPEPVPVGSRGNKLFARNGVLYGTDSADEFIDFMMNLDNPAVVEAAYSWSKGVSVEEAPLRIC